VPSFVLWERKTFIRCPLGQIIAMDRGEGKTSMLEKGGALTIEIVEKEENG
jgi:hypothetical protein